MGETDTTQKCLKCGKTLDISLFYKNKNMSSGYLKKCIHCVKIDCKEARKLLRLNPEWVEKERARCREKERKFGWKRRKPSPEEHHRSYINHKKKYPEKVKVRELSQYLEREDGKSNHHWSYRMENARDIIPLTTKQHRLVHRHMIYDQERMMYRRLDGTLIDSRESAIAYYETLND